MLVCVPTQAFDYPPVPCTDMKENVCGASQRISVEEAIQGSERKFSPLTPAPTAFRGIGFPAAIFVNASRDTLTQLWHAKNATPNNLGSLILLVSRTSNSARILRLSKTMR